MTQYNGSCKVKKESHVKIKKKTSIIKNVSKPKTLTELTNSLQPTFIITAYIESVLTNRPQPATDHVTESVNTQKLIKPQFDMSNKIITKHDEFYRSYRPMLIILLICGYDFKAVKNPTILYTLMVMVYCLGLVASVIFASIACCPYDLSQLWSLFEYSASVILILFCKSNTEEFFNKLMNIDAYLRINRRHHKRSKWKLIGFSLITWTVRITYTYFYCRTYPCYNGLILYGIRQFSLISLDLNRVWRCLLFDSIRFRLKMLRIRLQETPECNYYLYVINNKSIKEDKMKFCLYIYRYIADLVDVISPELHASLFLSVAGSLPKLISNVYHILTAIEGHEPVESLSYVVMHVVQISLLLFSPFLVVEFYSVEADRIKLFLMHRLIDNNDPEIKEDIQLFLRYTELRPFKYKIWRVIPINLTLPLELVNLCVNYVIVVINFTHLYG